MPYLVRAGPGRIDANPHAAERELAAVHRHLVGIRGFESEHDHCATLVGEVDTRVRRPPECFGAEARRLRKRIAGNRFVEQAWAV